MAAACHPSSFPVCVLQDAVSVLIFHQGLGTGTKTLGYETTAEGLTPWEKKLAI